MSRRGAGPDRQEQNRATLKSLVKLEGNKSCADCKRSKHPRWASWNIGVFICIRCSGIHRSMGVHISRVKSVDLDSWTDEQMASMLRWGNARANKYWEHKLAEGHVPNEAKIENFIRTKYDSKRWVMDGPIPDPSTLDDGTTTDDDVPLNVVREKATMQRAGSVRNGTAAAGGSLQQPPRARPQQVDLFGDFNEPTPVRPNTTDPAINRAATPKATAAPPKQTRQGESLLGLDFFGGTQSAPPRPASATSGLSTPGVPGRTDLKNSILSLYASAPRPAAAVQPQQQPQSNMNLFGGMQSPTLTSPTQQPSSAQSMGSMNDAFGSLSFASTPQAKPAPFSGLTSPTGHARQQNSLSGGSFFDAKPVPPPKQVSQAPSLTAARKASNNFADFGDFSSAPSHVSSTKNPLPASNAMGDLFSMSSVPPQPKPMPAPASVPAQRKPSFPTAAAFNLSSPAQPSAPKPAPPQVQTSTSNFSALGNMDPWGSDNAWSTPDPAPQSAPPAQASTAPNMHKPQPAPPAVSTQSGFDAGWGDPDPAAPAPAPKFDAISSSGGGFSVQQDEEFGGWSHASPVATTSGPKQGGLGGNQDDLFGNVWN